MKRLLNMAQSQSKQLTSLESCAHVKGPAWMCAGGHAVLLLLWLHRHSPKSFPAAEDRRRLLTVSERKRTSVCSGRQKLCFLPDLLSGNAERRKGLKL